MKIEDLLKHCRYYHGEKKNPYEGKDQNKAMLWEYEEIWMHEYHRDTPACDFFDEMLDEYDAAGLSDFRADDGVPVTLKALLFNRYAKTANSMADAVEPFKKFYEKYYQPNMFLIMDTRFDNYSFFRGEKTCPFTDFGRRFWWTVESYAVEYGDDKVAGELSPTMWNYLREKMWQGDGQPDTSEYEFKNRAEEMYRNGVWSRSYLNVRDFPRTRIFSETN